MAPTGITIATTMTTVEDCGDPPPAVWLNAVEFVVVIVVF
jgi:hypothetical protein